MFVEISVGYKFGLEAKLLSSFLGDLVSFVESVLYLILAFLEKIFELLILIAIFAVDMPPGRKYHVFQLLLLLALLGQLSRYLSISLPDC
jgi:hypothetical protein